MRIPPRRVLVAVLAGVVASAGFIIGNGNPAGAAASEFLFATAPGPGGGPRVRLFHADGTPTTTDFMAYAPTFAGGVEVAMGDIDGDGADEIITAAGAGGGPHVRVFDLNGQPVDHGGFMAYAPTFTGGVHVGVADVDGDGTMEIVTGAGPGGGPHVRVWKYVNGAWTVLSETMAYDPSFHGGVFVSGAFTSAGQSDPESIVTAAGPGGGPHVKVWTHNLTAVTNQFMAYGTVYNGGVSVSSWDENGDGVDEIVTSALALQGHVRSWNVNAPVTQGDVGFMAYDAKVFTGVQIGTMDGSNFGPFLAAPYLSGTGPCAMSEAPPNCADRGDYVRGYDEAGDVSMEALPYGASWLGGVRVAGGFGVAPVVPPATTTTTAAPTTTTTSTSTTTTSTTVP